MKGGVDTQTLRGSKPRIKKTTHGFVRLSRTESVFFSRGGGLLKNKNPRCRASLHRRNGTLLVSPRCLFGFGEVHGWGAVGVVPRLQPRLFPRLVVVHEQAALAPVAAPAHKVTAKRLTTVGVQDVEGCGGCEKKCRCRTERGVDGDRQENPIKMPPCDSINLIRHRCYRQTYCGTGTRDLWEVPGPQGRRRCPCVGGSTSPNHFTSVLNIGRQPPTLRARGDVLLTEPWVSRRVHHTHVPPPHFIDSMVDRARPSHASERTYLTAGRHTFSPLPTNHTNEKDKKAPQEAHAPAVLPLDRVAEGALVPLVAPPLQVKRAQSLVPGPAPAPAPTPTLPLSRVRAACASIRGRFLTNLGRLRRRQTFL